MGQTSNHLSLRERVEIELLRAAGHSVRWISRALGRSAATISRQVSRNAKPTNSGGVCRARWIWRLSRRASCPGWRRPTTRRRANVLPFRALTRSSQASSTVLHFNRDSPDP